ncbi:hypothetical protein [Conexibacter arvalis]|uniref:Uncharacterized protein n=1 Tax=Conexibacter arvalis TaxID=912552 RepID=A0A840IIJ6_9ACTN|nr:hypothetical protein [Conexibacter arvalis]MBB4664041.1 hypothetical protein [Conexibacter arvalis]
MAARTVTEIPRRGSDRRERAALGVIATYLHELTEHGRPRDDDAETTVAAAERDDELADCQLAL